MFDTTPDLKLPPEVTESAQSSALSTQHSLEASFAPHEGDLLSLPFDQYGRMRIVQNLLHVLYTEIASHIRDTPIETDERSNPQEPYKLSVLDVGGYPGILRHFVDEKYYHVSVLDVGPDDGSIPGYTQGSGMELPFRDGSFDVVTALDTLEHIPNDERDRFLSEAMRVARHAVVLINPIQSIEADLAEETLNDYIRWILDAQQEQLAEHRMYGLPNFAHTQNRFHADGWTTTTFTTANIYNWLFMMVAKHYLISMRDEKADAFERTLDRFYNLTFSETDMTEPAYRGVLVATRPALEPALHKVRATYPPVPSSDAANAQRLGLAQTLMSMLNLKIANHEDKGLREQMERRDQHIAAMEQKLAIIDLQLDHSRAEALTLQDQALTLRADLQAQVEHGRNLDTILNQTREAFRVEMDKQAEYINRLEADRQSKDDHIRYLEKLLQGIEAGRVMRLTRAVARFLGRR